METYDPAYVERKAQADAHVDGALTQFDRELDRFEKSLERLAAILRPVTSQHALREADDYPSPEPPSELHGKVERLSRQLAALDRMMNEVAL